MNPLMLFLSPLLENCPTTLLIGLWGYTLFYWVKPYVHRTLRRLVWVGVQLLSIGLIVYYAGSIFCSLFQETLLSSLASLYQIIDDFSLYVPQPVVGPHVRFYYSVCFLLGWLPVGAFWLVTRAIIS
jgi:hypothetical protein